MNSKQFEILSNAIGTHNACDILNGLISKRMQEEHPEYGETMNRHQRDTLWQQYCERYTGSAADELLTDEILAEYIESYGPPADPANMPIALLARLESRSLILVSKIVRYENYIEKDQSLVAKNPAKYTNRLLNHKEKLARYKRELDDITATLSRLK